MLKEPAKIFYQSACAFIDWEQFELLGRCKFIEPHAISMEALLEKMYRLKNGISNPFIREFIGHFGCSKIGATDD